MTDQTPLPVEARVLEAAETALAAATAPAVAATGATPAAVHSAARARAAEILVVHGDMILPEGWVFDLEAVDEATNLRLAEQLVDGVVSAYMEALNEISTGIK